MTEEKNNPLSDLVKSIKVPAELTKATLEPSANQIGEGLGNLFYIAFSPILKAKIRKEHEVNIFRQEIEEEIAKIPSGKITVPPLNIAGPALEAAKYYIENDEIRSMFAKLIASSMNIESSNNAHNSFIEIIKQLSPLDAKNFKYLINNQNIIGVGKIKSKYRDGDQGEITHIDPYFPFPDMNLTNFSLFSASVDNLIRLGLINIEHGFHFTHKSRYEKLYSHPIFSEYKNAIEYENIHQERSRDLLLVESIWNVTDFGKHFSHCCL